MRPCREILLVAWTTHVRSTDADTGVLHCGEETAITTLPMYTRSTSSAHMSHNQLPLPPHNHPCQRIETKGVSIMQAATHTLRGGAKTTCLPACLPLWPMCRMSPAAEARFHLASPLLPCPLGAKSHQNAPRGNNRPRETSPIQPIPARQSQGI